MVFGECEISGIFVVITKKHKLIQVIPTLSVLCSLFPVSVHMMRVREQLIGKYFVVLLARECMRCMRQMHALSRSWSSACDVLNDEPYKKIY